MLGGKRLERKEKADIVIIYMMSHWAKDPGNAEPDVQSGLMPSGEQVLFLQNISVWFTSAVGL